MKRESQNEEEKKIDDQLKQINNKEIEELTAGVQPERKHRKIFKYNSSEQIDVCQICYGSFLNNQIFVEMDCKHKFHVACYEPWGLEKCFCNERRTL